GQTQLSGMRIAIDAMGGDIGPEVMVEGAIAGARAFDVAISLVGDPDAIQQCLNKIEHTGLQVAVVEATQSIGMDEHPAQAARRKPNSSIAVALREVHEHRASAMVSAGNSGAVMAAALLILGRIPGIDRPAIASYMPTARFRTLVLDLGAVTDPRPSNLVQFARMGRVYAQQIMELKNPTLGLLSNGEEPTKGNLFVQEVFPLLAAEPELNFQGNVEGKDVALGTVDIVLTDGFTGNVALKVAEGVGSMLSELIRTEVTANIPRKLAALVLRPAFRAVRAKLDYSEIGGAPLLGVNGAVIIAHGRSNEKAIKNSVGVARRAAAADLVGAIQRVIAAKSTKSANENQAAEEDSKDFSASGPIRL
ncbi:MAG: phosphate acyltransferase PlsX, partial [Chloroflexota bacterium]|nr:phosphate acyltransferase PlsX [Chloroflexota bacterium]